GVREAERIAGVESFYTAGNMQWPHLIDNSLKAHHLYQRDVNYVVQDGEVVIVDEFTGRLMPGRRWSDGLHQAIEAKEGVRIANENQTLASVTFQNFFRMYEKLAGMTGTADTEAAEFKKIYNLDVTVIPTHNPMIRVDYADAVYKNVQAKYRAIVREIKELHTKGQPVLVGTISIDVSEKISNLLKKEGIPHAVLNAKHHEKEAQIVAEAGQRGKVTIATNMAGRGTDIKLGDGVAELGGLHILGTSRHESRRIDNQLRGRSGRQGDPGSSRFYLSLEDDLLRIFGSDRISGIMDRLGMEEDEPIEHAMISRAIENAQRKVEGHNFEIRKHLLEYDDVMNKQREVIYRQRREVLAASDVSGVVRDMLGDLAENAAPELAEARLAVDEWDWPVIEERFAATFGFALPWSTAEREEITDENLGERLLAALIAAYEQRERELGTENLRHLERLILLQMVDTHWKEHLLNMDHLKEGIGLRGYGQKNPLNEYKKEGFAMFMAMIETVKQQTVNTLFRLQLVEPDEVSQLEEQQRQRKPPMQLHHGEEEAERKPQTREHDKIGRNDPCPCGSEK
ncbi:MAG TPA: helicase-related protein, partial [Desulfurivibrionaceae bacterium]|nr:helicase-related protein [Desulfurivibrionaceae bacterium]